MEPMDFYAFLKIYMDFYGFLFLNGFYRFLWISMGFW